jgi:hypothetical protein
MICGIYNIHIDFIYIGFNFKDFSNYDENNNEDRVDNKKNGIM